MPVYQIQSDSPNKYIQIYQFPHDKEFDKEEAIEFLRFLVSSPDAPSQILYFNSPTTQTGAPDGRNIIYMKKAFEAIFTLDQNSLQKFAKEADTIATTMLMFFILYRLNAYIPYNNLIKFFKLLFKQF